jgi:hypothetical protein
MFGLAMLIIVAAYVLFARFVTKRMPTRKLKWVAVAVFVLIPTGDTAVGYVYFRTLCATEAGNKIYKTAENVEGFYGTSGDAYFKYGYRYTEDRAPDGRYRRWTLASDGRLAWEDVAFLQSRYGYKYSDFEKYSSQIDKYQVSIYDLKTGETLGKRTRLGFRGGWLTQKPGLLIGRRGGVMTWCPADPNGDTNLLLNTLKPVQ